MVVSRCKRSCESFIVVAACCDGPWSWLSTHSAIPLIIVPQVCTIGRSFIGVLCTFGAP